MLEVKAIWTVGYPAGEEKKIYSDGDVFKCDDAWGNKRAEQGKVEILNEVKEEKEEPPVKNKINVLENEAKDEPIENKDEPIVNKEKQAPPANTKMNESENEIEPETKTPKDLKTIEEQLDEYNQGYGWYKLPEIKRNLRKDKAIEILKEKM